MFRPEDHRMGSVSFQLTDAPGHFVLMHFSKGGTKSSSLASQGWNFENWLFPVGELYEEKEKDGAVLGW